MMRLNILVEGQTEERFVKEELYYHLLHYNIITTVQRWFTNRKSGAKGGGKSYDFIQNHLDKWIGQEGHDTQVYFSVMVDLYAFPKQGNTLFTEEVKDQRSGSDKVLLLEGKMRERTASSRFIPYVQLHEFEALLLSDPAKFATYYVGKEDKVRELTREIGDQNPEDINQTPQGAPSKRIEKYFPEYSHEKTAAGPAIARAIGLSIMRRRCPHFNDWVTRLEQIGSI